MIDLISAGFVLGGFSIMYVAHYLIQKYITGGRDE